MDVVQIDSADETDRLPMVFADHELDATASTPALATDVDDARESIAIAPYPTGPIGIDAARDSVVSLPVAATRTLKLDALRDPASALPDLSDLPRLPGSEPPPRETLLSPQYLELPKQKPPSVPPFALDPQDSMNMPALRTRDWSIADMTSRIFLAQRGPTPIMKIIAGAAIAASLIILAGAVVRMTLDARAQKTTVVLNAKPAGPTTFAPPSAITAPVTPVTTAAPPAVTTPSSGTITVIDGRRGFSLDGTAIGGNSAMVSCGPHVVRLGHEKPRNVDVPCGGTLTLR